MRNLKRQVRGEVLVPSDVGYDEARRIFNAAIDRRPAVIVRCTAASDVVAAVQCARAQNLPVSIRGGGHSGSCGDRHLVG